MRPQLLVCSASLEPLFPDNSLVLAHAGVLPPRISRRWEHQIESIHEWSKSGGADLAETHAVSRQYYERLLPALTRILNGLHSVAHSAHYWEIMLGPWLNAAVGIIVERFRNLESLLREHPDAKIGLSPPKYQPVPATTQEFVVWCTGDVFNLTIYSKLLRSMSPSLAHDAPIVSISNNSTSPPSKGWKKTARLILNFLSRPSLEDAIVLHQSTFSRRDLLRLAWISKGAIRPAVYLTYEPPHTKVDADCRVRIGILLDFLEGREGAVLREIIPWLIPKCYVEDFSALVEQSRCAFPVLPRSILTANSLFYDELFKDWAGRCVMQGRTLLAAQHGGNYGVEKRLDGMQHEISVAKKFYSWGWARQHCQKIEPMPAIKLAEWNVRRDRTNRRRPGSRILYVTTARPRYPIDLLNLSQPAEFNQYLSWQVNFLALCSRDLRQRIYLRIHPGAQSWEVKESMTRRFDDLKTDDESTLERSIKSCSILICDHLSTIYAQTIAADVPTLLFWHPRWFDLEAGAEPYVDELQKMGVLHYSVESAAMKLEQIADTPEEWWRKVKKERAFNRFADQFARTSDSYIHDWHRVLMKDTAS